MLTMRRIVTGPTAPFKRKMARWLHFGMVWTAMKGGFRS